LSSDAYLPVEIFFVQAKIKKNTTARIDILSKEISKKSIREELYNE